MDKHGHNKKIGLLGGSFNPAHDGHLEISLAALDYLGLDEVWWLVSPGNPLKDKSDMAPYGERFSSAENIVNDKRIKVSDIENKLATKYTIDTLIKLKEKNPNHHFIWLMGADNLVQFNQWKDWQKIAKTVPFAIFNRPSYSKSAKMSIAATELDEFKVSEEMARDLYKLKPPAWTYYGLTNNPVSSTELRRKDKT